MSAIKRIQKGIRNTPRIGASDQSLIPAKWQEEVKILSQLIGETKSSQTLAAKYKLVRLYRSAASDFNDRPVDPKQRSQSQGSDLIFT